MNGKQLTTLAFLANQVEELTKRLDEISKRLPLVLIYVDINRITGGQEYISGRDYEGVYDYFKSKYKNYDFIIVPKVTEEGEAFKMQVFNAENIPTTTIEELRETVRLEFLNTLKN